MAKKITIDDDLDLTEDPAVVAKVDKMMDPEVKEEQPAEASSEPDNPSVAATDGETSSDGQPPLDIFADAPGAPELVKTAKAGKQKNEPAESTEDSSRQAEAPSEPDDRAPDPTDDPEPEDTPVEGDPIEAQDFDDPTTAKAIDDIVAHESDVVLDIEDSKTAQAEAEAGPVPEEKSGHKLFWSLVFIVCLIAIAMAVFIIDPSIHLPVKHFNWSTIKRHL